MDKKNERIGRVFASCEDFIDFEFFKVMFDPVRFELLAHISHTGPQSIGEIAANFKQDRSVISRHLNLMYKSGILTKTKENRFTIYETDSNKILEKFEETVGKMRYIINDTDGEWNPQE